MKITRAQLKETLRTIMKEESEYQIFFKKALEKSGKSIADMSDDEKKDFFNKIDAAWDGKGEKNEGNAFGAAVTAAKEAGEDEFEVGGKTYKVEESMVPKMYVTYLAVEKKLRELEEAQKEMAKKYFAEKDAKKKADLLDKLKKGTKVLQYTRKNLSDIENKYVTGLDKDAEYQGESVVNEGSHGMATKLLKSIVSGDTKHAEGIKMSKELAQHYIDWISSSPFGKKNSNLPLYMLVNASFNWGIERGLNPKLKGELAKLKDSTKKTAESVNEGRAFINAAKKAKAEGKTEFEFNGKKYPVTIKD